MNLLVQSKLHNADCAIRVFRSYDEAVSWLMTRDKD
jgi:hypothetical protein